MTYNLYSVRDVKTSFNAPFVDSNHDSAKRGFFYAFSNGTNIYQFSPADFCLYHVGYFDSDSGHVTHVMPTYICCASDFVKNDEIPCESEE